MCFICDKKSCKLSFKLLTCVCACACVHGHMSSLPFLTFAFKLFVTPTLRSFIKKNKERRQQTLTWNAPKNIRVQDGYIIICEGLTVTRLKGGLVRTKQRDRGLTCWSVAACFRWASNVSFWKTSELISCLLLRPPCDFRREVSPLCECRLASCAVAADVVGIFLNCFYKMWVFHVGLNNACCH